MFLSYVPGSMPGHFTYPNISHPFGKIHDSFLSKLCWILMLLHVNENKRNIFAWFDRQFNFAFLGSLSKIPSHWCCSDIRSIKYIQYWLLHSVTFWCWKVDNEEQDGQIRAQQKGNTTTVENEWDSFVKTVSCVAYNAFSGWIFNLTPTSFWKNFPTACKWI